VPRPKTKKKSAKKIGVTKKVAKKKAAPKKSAPKKTAPKRSPVKPKRVAVKKKTGAKKALVKKAGAKKAGAKRAATATTKLAAPKPRAKALKMKAPQEAPPVRARVDLRPEPTALLVEGPLADRARDALAAIADALVRVTPAQLTNPSLASGHAGLALAHAYLAPLFPELPHPHAMQEMIEAAMTSIARRPTSPSLLSGFLGLAWLVQHLQGGAGSLDEGDEGAAEDPNSSIDEEMLQWLDHSPWEYPFDLIEGLVGVGVYGLERHPTASGTAILEKVVERLAEVADTHPEGVAWPTHSKWIPDEFRGARPERYYDLGLAHGQAGVLGVLGAICARGVAVDRAAPLLERGLAWTFAQRLPDNPTSFFPTWILPEKTPEPARDAWCYGDPGMAVALLIAARGAKSAAWEEAALAVARKAAARDMATTKCFDAGLCHGSFGNAQIFHRLYRMTGEAVFADRARAFLEHGLGHRKETGGVGGFFAWDFVENEAKWMVDPGFLTGAAGIALVLTAALAARDDDPSWDRALLLSAEGV
jgi:hypothetical protein